MRRKPRGYGLATLLLLVLAAWLLSGCLAPAPPMPSYVVRIGTSLSGSRGYCTGVVLAPDTVLTAAHCRSLAAVVATDRTASLVTKVQVWESSDLALLTVVPALTLPVYAQLGEPVVGVPAVFYGYCPLYLNGGETLGRLAFYAGRMAAQWDIWLAQAVWACSGDSGGPLIQGDRVVGVISAVASDQAATTGDIKAGRLFFSAPAGGIGRGEQDLFALCGTGDRQSHQSERPGC